MWKCPDCHRPFATRNQSHVCNDVTVDELFAGKPDELLLAFDEILVAVMDWQPNHVAAATRAVVFTNRRAWLIVRPMSKELDVAFYTDGVIAHPAVKKSVPMGKSGRKFRHNFRLSGPGELSQELVSLLRRGFDFGNR